MADTTFAELFSKILAGKDSSLTQAVIAERIGVDKSTVSKWLMPGANIKPKRENILGLRRCSFTPEEVNQLLAAAGYTALTRQETAPQPAEADLQTYLQTVYSRQAVVELNLFQEGQESQFAAISLQALYIPLRLSGRPADERDPTVEKPDRDELRADQLLDPDQRLGRHLVILGDAGSGKTTILRHLADALAQARLGHNLALAGQATGLTATAEADLPIPLFVPLRYLHHFCQEAGHTRRAITPGSFIDFLPWYFADHFTLTLDTAFYKRLLASGRCLLALDGFDEVADDQARGEVVQLAQTLVGTPATGQNLIVLTSRTAAYGGANQMGVSFQILRVQNLSRDERTTQVTRWVEAIASHTQRHLEAAAILDHLPEGSPLDDLVVTPMIVTALCVIYFHDHKLPEQRAQFYRRCIEIMLFERLRHDRLGRTLAEQGGTPEQKRQLLARLAFEMHRAGRDEVSKEQAARWLKPGFKGLAEEDQLAAAYGFLAVIIVRGTLLQERGGLYGFGRQHLTFREYLVGHHLILALRAQERGQLWPDLILEDRWREPIRLAVGAAIKDFSVTVEDFLAELLSLSDAPDANPARQLAGYKLAAEALWDLGEIDRNLLDKGLQQRVTHGLAARLTDPAIAAPKANLLTQRVAAAEALGRLGDPREGVTTLPPTLTERIEGEFLYGEDKETRRVPPFRAGIYPITNAQFEQFIKAGGYEAPQWWSEAGLAWLQEPPDYRQRPVNEPEYWHDSTLNNPNQPVVGVSYYEAEAFCSWLSDTFGQVYRLPTEEEWERLARGQQGYEYPWGDEWQAGLANTSESSIGRPSAVGLFPGGKSLTEAYDCAGNVWEWCGSWYDEDEDTRALRGGSWVDLQDSARCVARNYYDPYHGYFSVGFRVVAPISES